MPVTPVVQIEGLDIALRRIGTLGGDQLHRRVAAVIVTGANSEMVPAMKAATPIGPGKRGRNPHAPGTLQRSMRATRARKRPGEMVAVKVGPRTTTGSRSTRAWYAHFVVRGTKPHLISAPGLSPRTIRRINRGITRGEARALAFNGIIRSAVRHPGARANDGYVRAGRSRIPALEQRLVQMLTSPEARSL
jgi:hypothetical protein